MSRIERAVWLGLAALLVASIAASIAAVAAAAIYSQVIQNRVGRAYDSLKVGLPAAAARGVLVTNRLPIVSESDKHIDSIVASSFMNDYMINVDLDTSGTVSDVTVLDTGLF